MQIDRLGMGKWLGLGLTIALAGCSDDGTDTTQGGTTTVAASETSEDTAVGSTTAPGSTTGTPTTSAGTDGTVSGTVATTTDATTTDATTTDATTGPAPICGDSNVDVGEECDDGNADDTDACTSACKAAVCGDTLVQAGVEDCDDGNDDDADACTNACKNAACGDGIVGPGETCDDGNQVDDDACSNMCAPGSCGDAKVQVGEECDDGNMVDTDACLSSCKAATCGDMAVQAGVEDCDDANMVNTDACLDTCKAAKCGDMVVQAGVDECDDGNMVNTDACLDTCKTAKCGDMVVQAGVDECDDGNMVQTDACLNTCKAAKCGDGQVQAGVEECDDANMVNGDGCENTCKKTVLASTGVYLTSSNGTAGFYHYNIQNNSWTTLSNPPVVTYSQITNDGKVVYLMGSNNTVYAYDPIAKTWSNKITGPGGMTSGPIGFFQWFDAGFYYLKDGSTALYVYRNNAWKQVALPGSGSSAGTWDKAKNELYIRTYGQLGFRVINTLNDALARTITDATNVGENSRTGSFSKGFFYTRTFTEAFQKFDGVSGVKSNTGQDPVSDHTGTDTDHGTGFIYISGYGGAGTSFQVFDPAANKITTLANQPNVSNHSTITVMR